MAHPLHYTLNSSNFSAADWSALRQAYTQAQNTGQEAIVAISDGSGRRAAFDPMTGGSVEIQPGQGAWASAPTNEILAH